MIRHAGDDWVRPSTCSLLGGLFGGGSSSSSQASTNVTVNPTIQNIVDLTGVEKVLATVHADQVATSRTQLAGTLLAAERAAQAQESAAADARASSQLTLEWLSQAAAVLVAVLTVWTFLQRGKA